MTDLEMTRLCAEAMGYPSDGYGNQYGILVLMGHPFTYDPYHDDAQAMALVKKMNIQIHWHGFAGAPLKMVTVKGKTEPYGEVTEIRCEDLNRAIVECVAKMQDKQRRKREEK